MLSGSRLYRAPSNTEDVRLRQRLKSVFDGGHQLSDPIHSQFDSPGNADEPIEKSYILIRPGLLLQILEDKCYAEMFIETHMSCILKRMSTSTLGVQEGYYICHHRILG